MPNEGATPDPDLKNLHDQLVQQAKHLEKQHLDLVKHRENLNSKIVELEKMIEALSAAIESASKHLPTIKNPGPNRDPYEEAARHSITSYPQGLGS